MYSGFHLLSLLENGTEQKDMIASLELNIASDGLHQGETITNKKQSKPLSQGNDPQYGLDIAREPVYGSSFTKVFQLTDESSCIRQSYVGRSTKNHLTSAVSKCKIEKLVHTKGTTTIFRTKKSYFGLYIDSRESIERGNFTYIIGEMLKKYRVLWGKVVVHYIGEVLTGRAVLKYLDDKTSEENQLTVDEVGVLAYEFTTSTAGRADIFIGSLLENGTPRLLRIIIDNKNTEMIRKRSLGPITNKIKLHIYGSAGSISGSAGSGAAFTELSADKGSKKRKRTAGIVDDKLISVEEKSIIQAFMGHKVTGGISWVQKGLFFVLRIRKEQEQDYFSRWFRASAHGKRKTFDLTLHQPVAKIKRMELVFTTISFKDAKYANNVVDLGRPNKRVINGVKLLKFDFEGKVFYLSKPSLAVLKALKDKSTTIDEYNIFLEDYQDGLRDTTDEEVDVNPDDLLTEGDEEEGSDYEEKCSDAEEYGSDEEDG
ncbi:hypothetical protein OROMI_016732 [Orobanche minor]